MAQEHDLQGLVYELLLHWQCLVAGLGPYLPNSPDSRTVPG